MWLDVPKNRLYRNREAIGNRLKIYIIYCTLIYYKNNIIDQKS